MLSDVEKASVQMAAKHKDTPMVVWLMNHLACGKRPWPDLRFADGRFHDMALAIDIYGEGKTKDSSTHCEFLYRQIPYQLCRYMLRDDSLLGEHEFILWAQGHPGWEERLVDMALQGPDAMTFELARMQASWKQPIAR